MVFGNSTDPMGGGGGKRTPVHDGAGNIDTDTYIPIFRKAYRCPILFWLSPLLKMFRLETVSKGIKGNLIV